ncbi:MAG TPA: hypothetical protein VGI39_30360 [Polyangiaceae bacterium]|jgi:hypothetical protein
MKKRYVATMGLCLVSATILACSGGSGTDAETTASAVSQGSGPCDAPVLQVIVKEKEHRFGVNDQQVALNPDIPIHNICLNFIKSSCKAVCSQAEAAAVATGVKGFSGDNVPAQLRAMGQLADAFNAALGNRSDFAEHPIDQDPGATSNDPNASTTASAGAATDAGSSGAVACNATVLQVIVNAKEHRFGFDNQQVALNPAIPIQNICQNRVSAGCKGACNAAASAAAATGVKGFSGTNVPAHLRAMGELADTFNAALGNKSDFTDHPIDQDPGVDPAADPNASTTP